MRILLDIDDCDMGFVDAAKEVKGEVVVFIAPGRAIRAAIVGTAVPHSVAGQGDKYTALYDITLLEAVHAEPEL